MGLREHLTMRDDEAYTSPVAICIGVLLLRASEWLLRNKRRPEPELERYVGIMRRRLRNVI